MPFDNLTAEPSLDWMAAAAPAIVAEQLTGAAAAFPVRVQTLGDAYAAKATRFVHGYFDHRGGALHFEVSIEDADRHKMVATSSMNGELIPAMNSLARSIDPTARGFSTANAQAMSAWGQGDFAHAVGLDPDFSGAWVSLVQSRMAARDPEGALNIASGALARPSITSPIDRAQLELLTATVRGDETAREKALGTLAHLLPNDPSIFRTLADLYMNARRFPEAVAQYQALQRLDPDERLSFNQLGYAQALAGDLDGAQKSFERYGQELGQEANSLDSLGEAMFLNGQFAKAEKYFLDAGAKNSNGGVELLKAAYARWLQGDLPKADEMFAQYRDLRSKMGDPLVLWRVAVWEYSTGRTKEAISRLENASGQAEGPAGNVANGQLAIWRNPDSVPHDPATLKQAYYRTPPTADGLIRTLYASALMQTGQTEEAKKLIALWPLPESPGDELLRSLIYPKYLELKQKLK